MRPGAPAMGRGGHALGTASATMVQRPGTGSAPTSAGRLDILKSWLAPGCHIYDMTLKVSIKLTFENFWQGFPNSCGQGDVSFSARRCWTWCTGHVAGCCWQRRSGVCLDSHLFHSAFSTSLPLCVVCMIYTLLETRVVCMIYMLSKVMHV